MASLTGRLLIASPYLPDPTFFRAVVYILRHDEEGAFGLVLNRPTEQTIESVLQEITGRPPTQCGPIFRGGPVEGPLTALHTRAEVADLGCPGGLYATTEQQALLALADRSDGPVRFFNGYSGWGPGQLDRELEVGGWLSARARHGDVFADPEPLWEAAVRRVGRSILGAITPAEDSGFDPLAN